MQGAKGQKETQKGSGWQSSSACYACLSDLQPSSLEEERTAEVGVIVRCPDCSKLFCFDCDAYIHETLHNCPGCLCLNKDESAEDRGHTDDAAAMEEG